MLILKTDVTQADSRAKWPKFWQSPYESKTIAFCYFVSIRMIEEVFLMKILLKMCLQYINKRKISTYKTATLTSQLVGNNSEFSPKFGNFVQAV